MVSAFKIILILYLNAGILLSHIIKKQLPGLQWINYYSGPSLNGHSQQKPPSLMWLRYKCVHHYY